MKYNFLFAPFGRQINGYGDKVPKPYTVVILRDSDKFESICEANNLKWIHGTLRGKDVVVFECSTLAIATYMGHMNTISNYVNPTLLTQRVAHKDELFSACFHTLGADLNDLILDDGQNASWQILPKFSSDHIEQVPDFDFEYIEGEWRQPFEEFMKWNSPYFKQIQKE